MQTAPRKRTGLAPFKLGEGSFQAGTEGHRLDASAPERVPPGGGKRGVSC